MKIKFLGTGSTFVSIKENFNSNVIIFNDDINLLIDAGFHISESLEFHDIALKDINAIFLTHNHTSTNGGLEQIGYKTFFDTNLEKPVLLGDPKVIETLWNKVLSGNMGSLLGKRVLLDNYFEVRIVPPKCSFVVGGISYIPVRMPHVIDDYDEIPAYGLKWEHNGVRCFFSGDVMFDFWRLMPFWEYGDIIFQNCEFHEDETSIHTQFKYLKDIPDKYKKKMWLYHYSLGDKTYEELEQLVLEAEFKGLVKRGQEFNIGQEN
jgi:hypothetical protein